MDDKIKALKIAARFLKFDKPKAERPSGAQRKRDMRERTQDKNGVWCLPKPLAHERVLRGRAR